MRNKILPLVAVVSATALSGCSTFNSPKLYGNESCGDNKTAYVYSSGNAAICLNESSVAYMVCSRELGVLTTEINTTRKANFSAEALDEATLTGGLETTDNLVVTSASDGVIAVATAKAIDTCVKIHDNYR